MDDYKVWDLLSCFSRISEYYKRKRVKEYKKNHQKAIPKSSRSLSTEARSADRKRGKIYSKKWEKAKRTRDKEHRFLSITVEKLKNINLQHFEHNNFDHRLSVRLTDFFQNSWKNRHAIDIILIISDSAHTHAHACNCSKKNISISLTKLTTSLPHVIPPPSGIHLSTHVHTQQTEKQRLKNYKEKNLISLSLPINYSDNIYKRSNCSLNNINHKKKSFIDDFNNKISTHIYVFEHIHFRR